MIFWNSQSHHRTSRGKGIVSKWSSIEKSILSEASDYFCYALYHQDLDPDSQKAVLTSPILKAQRYVRQHQGQETIENWLKEIAAKRSKPIPKLSDLNKKAIRLGL